ncbi:hypothetical protein PHYBLDRAFT_72405 [Phycomyces blakesleeanus NRRL 1555(-)]|uniref:Uncharacterized protein n=1 Tax=Phycomyces blakesleeanus (strain ATCC 8743b / DSM 1359 / FGSC 10004 / NBRC 33097 / NRRL 1555) TaxID=763407 RepID=A0A162ZBQ9_PHYB8|nr:hypothetical protein PHYBLDRAFT_72405 [Phycomyces blakesleeanus NRRL 1555(-)]OAD65681.1 hypothetical protein PHYBLDRAFT_72405 [Phycomyces blakesleeanus NRRL 1555(-)]|eukprot:XP_018283721.1 hypothetical protein PHYBLDRAFT_72405 [Phycomyces blakesleeanus NRRL 1555(-)]
MPNSQPKILPSSSKISQIIIIEIGIETGIEIDKTVTDSLNLVLLKKKYSSSNIHSIHFNKLKTNLQRKRIIHFITDFNQRELQIKRFGTKVLKQTLEVSCPDTRQTNIKIRNNVRGALIFFTKRFFKTFLAYSIKFRS